MFEDLKHFEGNVPFLYKDTKGVVTAGVGFALHSLLEAQRLQWFNPVQVAADWALLQRLPKGKTPNYYSNRMKARLTPEGIEVELRRRASGLLPTWALQLPDPAKAALLDIAYNTGSLKGWPKLCAAVQAKDWKRAADESNRPDVSHERNVWTAHQLLLCCDL